MTRFRHAPLLFHGFSIFNRSALYFIAEFAEVPGLLSACRWLAIFIAQVIGFVENSSEKISKTGQEYCRLFPEFYLPSC